MAKSSIHRGPSTLEVTQSELRVGTNAHPIAHPPGSSASDSELLDTYLDFVRSMRNSNGVVWLRNEDLEVLSQVIGRSADAIRTDLEGRMTVARVESNRARSKRRRMAFAAFGVAVVGSTLVVARPGSATKSSTASSRVGGNTAVASLSTTDLGINIGSAQSLTRIDGVLVEVDAAGVSDAVTQVGDAQTVTRQ
jgi:hypothetical protein